MQTAAFNLPNDERVVTEKGSKRTMLKNFQQAKFDKVLLPIADVAIVPADRSLVAFEPFFTHVLMHELMHGLGPQAIKVGGRDNDRASGAEGAERSARRSESRCVGPVGAPAPDGQGRPSTRSSNARCTPTFLASTFRTLRFGLGQTHAKGIAMQVNNLFDHGAIRVAADGRFSIDVPKAKKAVTDLTHDIMTIQATGDYKAADALLKKMVVVRPEVQRVLDRLSDVPVDIAPASSPLKELTPSMKLISS